MELMLGLPPMNQMDATATPMFDCFTDHAGLHRVRRRDQQRAAGRNESSRPNKFPTRNCARTRMVSAKLPLEKEDQCPEDVLNRIFWRAMKGAKPYPEWAVKAVDDD